MLISFFLPKFSYSKDFDIVTLQRFSELNLESEKIINFKKFIFMNYFDENKILKMVKESDSQLVNVSWYQAMQGHYLKTDGTTSEDKSFSFVVIRDFLWKIRE